MKEFLEKYGALGINDNFISGVIENKPLDESAGGIYADTKYMHGDFPEMPVSLWVISKHEDGAYCLDISKPTKVGEYAIVNYEFSHTQNPAVISQSFREFLCKWFLEGWANESA